MAEREKSKEELLQVVEKLRRRVAALERTGAGRMDESREQEHNLLRTLIDNLPDYIYVKDTRCRFVVANVAVARIMGAATPDDLLGKTDRDFYPEELASQYQEVEEQVLRSGQPVVNREEPGLDPNGAPHVLLTTQVPLKDRQGAVVGLVGLGRDITDLRQAQKELHSAHDELELRVQQRTAELASANEELNALMDNLPHNIYFKDLASRFLRINKAMADYFGLKDASMAIGKNDFDYFTEEHARQAIADEQEIMRSGVPVVDKEEKETWPDGHTTWVLTTKMPLRDKDGCIVGSFGISRDITEQKKGAEALRAAKEAAEAASRAKDAFLANMSHEIRTPLNAVIGMTELVLGTPLSPQQRDFLNTARDSGEALLTVINDILDFSKIEAGKFALDCRTFELRESLGDTMKAFAVRADRRGLELAIDVHPDVPYFVVGDCDRLRQVLVNLVGNALKFTEKGEVVLDVARESQSADEVALHFTVADTGIGIPCDKQAAIFEVFEQVDSSLKRRHGGTGLGLAIASRLVELMGGRIWVESELGHGSTFHFTARFGLAKEETAATDAVEPPSLRGLRALVVDDNATNRRILEEMLRAWGMAPTAVCGDAEAMESMHEARCLGNPYRLVLTDAHMPEVDGFILAEQIKDDAQLNSTVVMMLTSDDRPEAVARCEQLGIAAYLLKPIKQSELLEAIKLALGIAIPSKDALLALTRPRPVGPLRILVAEDSPVNQKLASALLEAEGHQVVMANNGKEALAAMESEKFDLVLMDVQMPEMDGLEATVAIRDLEKRTGAHIRIIAMTAHALKGDRQRCLEAGMDEYIAKPIHAGELFDLIECRSSRAAEAAPQPPPPAPPAEPVNWPEALQLVRGDKKLLAELVTIALPEIPHLMAAIRQDLAEGNALGVRLNAHTLKGSIRCFGGAAAFEQLLRLERMGSEGDLTEASSALAALEVEIARILQALTDYANLA